MITGDTVPPSAISTAIQERDEALKVLRDHHNWHLQSGVIGLPDSNGGWIEIDNAAEYSDSRLYERSALVLSDLPPEFKPVPRLGGGSNHWENWQMAMRRLKAAEERVEALQAELDKMRNERNALVAGLSSIVNFQGDLTRAQVRTACADILDGLGQTVHLMPNQSPILLRAIAAEAEVERLGKQIERMEYSDGDAEHWRGIVDAMQIKLDRMKIRSYQFQRARAELHDLLLGTPCEQIRHQQEIEAMTFALNEYADGLVNDIQLVRNIRDGISKPEDVLPAMEAWLVNCNNLAHAARETASVSCRTDTSVSDPGEKP